MIIISYHHLISIKYRDIPYPHEKLNRVHTHFQNICLMFQQKPESNQVYPILIQMNPHRIQNRE